MADRDRHPRACVAVAALLVGCAGHGVAETGAARETSAAPSARVYVYAELAPAAEPGRTQAFRFDVDTQLLTALGPVPNASRLRAADVERGFVFAQGDSSVAVLSVDSTSGALTAAPGAPFAAHGLENAGSDQGVVSFALDTRRGRLYLKSYERFSAHRCDPRTGVLTQVDPAPGARDEPSWVYQEPLALAADPLAPTLWAVHWGQRHGARAQNSLSTLGVGSDGRLESAPRERMPLPARGTSSRLTADPLGRFAWLAHRTFDGDAPALLSLAIERPSGAPRAVAGSTRATNCLAQPSAEASGRYLYAAECSRAPGPRETPVYDAVAAYRIDELTGLLTPVPGSPFALRGTTRGPEPLDGAEPQLDPSGRFLFYGLADPPALAVLAVDASTGGLSHVPGSPFAVGAWPQRLVLVGR